MDMPTKVQITYHPSSHFQGIQYGGVFTPKRLRVSHQFTLITLQLDEGVGGTVQKLELTMSNSTAKAIAGFLLAVSDSPTAEIKEAEMKLP